MNPITFLGLFAAMCTTIAFVPQVIKAARTKNTRDLSLGAYLILTIGVLAWLIYGFLIHNPPLIVANAITLILSVWILILKIRYK